MKKIVKRFEVDRKYWSGDSNYRGTSMLLCPEDYETNGRKSLCCLGFMALEAGFSENELAGNFMPGTNDPDSITVVDCPFLGPTEKQTDSHVDEFGEAIDPGNHAAELNDMDMGNDHKEQALIELFASHEVELVFVGNYESWVNSSK